MVIDNSLSIVIAVHNEEENLEPLCRQLFAVLSPLSCDWEIIYVDDDSTDKTWERLKEIRGRESRIRLIKVSRNLGQSAALRCGIQAATGATIITLDGDCQNDPADIPKMLRALEGRDLACGWRRQRKDSRSKKIPSRLANTIIGSLSQPHIHDTGCTLKAMRTKLARSLPIADGFHRFIPVLATLQGARIEELEVHHRPREHGASKYGWGRAFPVIGDLLFLTMLRCARAKGIGWRQWLLFLIVTSAVGMSAASSIIFSLGPLVMGGSWRAAHGILSACGLLGVSIWASMTSTLVRVGRYLRDPSQPSGEALVHEDPPVGRGASKSPPAVF